MPAAGPAAPTNLSATLSPASATVILSWTDNAAKATSYTVERSSGTTGVSMVIDRVSATATSCLDCTVGRGGTYSYRVEAFVGAVASPFSNLVSVTISLGVTPGDVVTPPDNVTPAVSASRTASPPAAPTNLSTKASAASVRLSWTGNAAKATSYTVERRVGTTGVWTVIGSNLPATAASYVDSKVSRGVAYSYRVEAFAGKAASGFSNVASAVISKVVAARPMALKSGRGGGARPADSTDGGGANATGFPAIRSATNRQGYRRGPRANRRAHRSAGPRRCCPGTYALAQADGGLPVARISHQM